MQLLFVFHLASIFFIIFSLDSSFMNWILILAALLIFMYVLRRRAILSKRRELHEKLKASWGLPKSNTYFDFDKIKRFYRNHNTLEAYQNISDQTALDLDLEAIFKYIDRTHSCIGQQYLYSKIRTIEKNKKNRETLINHLVQDENLRLRIQMRLHHLGHEDGYYFETLFNDNAIEKPKHIRWVYLSSSLSLLLVIGTFLFPIFIIPLIPILTINLFFHYKNKGTIYEYRSAIHQFKVTYKTCRELVSLKELRPIVNSTSFLNTLKKIELKSSLISFDKNIDYGIGILLWIPIEFVKITLNLEYILFYSLIQSFLNQKQALRLLFETIGEIDFALTVGSLKSGKNITCTPEFNNSKRIDTIDIYHPLIENPISNSLTLNQESLLLTGSNMSGKTTFVRTIAINALLAQTLGICFAKSYQAPFLKIYSSIRISDNLLNNTSYYLQEALTIKKFVTHSAQNTPCLFVLDEIFKGTNTRERISAGYAILDYLNQSMHFVMVATHDLELVELLQNKKFAVFHFREEIINDNLHFDYKLKHGKLKTQNAIKILELHQFPKAITKQALSIQKKLFN